MEDAQDDTDKNDTTIEEFSRIAPFPRVNVETKIEDASDKNNSDKVSVDDDDAINAGPIDQGAQSLSLKMFTIVDHVKVSDMVKISNATDEPDTTAVLKNEPSEPDKVADKSSDDKQVEKQTIDYCSKSMPQALESKPEGDGSGDPSRSSDVKSPGSVPITTESRHKRRGSPSAAPPCALVQMFTPEEKKDATESARATTGIYDQHLLTQHEQECHYESDDDDSVSFARDRDSENTLKAEDAFVDECPMNTTGNGNLPLLTQPDHNDDEDDDGHSCGSVMYRDTMMTDNDFFY